MDLVGYLELESDDGCRVVVDNYSTSQLVAADTGASWELIDECPECVCPTASEGMTDITEAPWYDVNRPQSREFFGLFGSLRLAQPGAQTVFTGNGSEVVAPLKQLTFDGVVVARTTRGAQYGLDWLSRVLEPDCGGCGGVTARVALWCPDELCFGDAITVDPVVVTEDWCLTGLQGCDPADPLDATPDPADINDNGIRQIPDVRYIPGSLVEIEDAGSPLPTCHGVRVTFAFAVQGSDRFAPIPGGCLMLSPQEGDCTDAVCCSDLVWDMTAVLEDDCGCVTACDCAPVVVEAPPGAVDLLADGAAVCSYSTPLCSQTYACLTSTFSHQNAVPTIAITAGTEDLYNVSVTIWRARAGLPSPTTVEGFGFYNQIDPIVDRALIHRIPAQSTLTLDGGQRRELLSCAGEDPVPYPVVRCGGRRYEHPVLCCGERYWVGLEVGCEQTGGWEMLTTLSGVERV